MKTAIVIGGGFIGLEAAAVLTKLGKQVVLLEASDRVMARVAGPPLSRFYEDHHRAHGVDLRLGVSVDRIVGNEAAEGVRLHDDTSLAAELVGIGIVPAVAPLLAAGAIGGNGVLVDPQCRTSLGDIFAIGDCALHANRFAEGTELRLESVQNATDQATVAAKTIAGDVASYDSVPWFWSNQYELKLKTVGLAVGYDDMVIRGKPEEGRFSLIYLKRGRIIALDCVNMTRDYVQGRKLVENGAMIAKDLLVNSSYSLKEMPA